MVFILRQFFIIQDFCKRKSSKLYFLHVEFFCVICGSESESQVIVKIYGYVVAFSYKMSEEFYFTVGYDEGWFLASDILLKLPLVIFCNVIYIPYRVRQLRQSGRLKLTTCSSLIGLHTCTSLLQKLYIPWNIG